MKIDYKEFNKVADELEKHNAKVYGKFLIPKNAVVSLPEIIPIEEIPICEPPKIIVDLRNTITIKPKLLKKSLKDKNIDVDEIIDKLLKEESDLK